RGRALGRRIQHPAVLRQLLGRGRRAVAPQVGRRRAQHGRLAHQAPRHQRGIGQRPGAHRQLNALLHQVDIGVVHRHVHPDGRVAAAELHQRRQDALAAEVVRASDAHFAARLGAQQLHAADAVVGFVQQALAMDAERFASRRQAEAARAALGQRHAELGFKGADVVADHGPRQAQRAGAGGKAAAAHHGGKHRHRAQFIEDGGRIAHYCLI
ncbi:conserved hypothetical protein, partial [Ricinus communis]